MAISDPEACHFSASGGALLRQLRQQIGLTQKEVARRADLSASVLSAYERGHREPGIETFFHIVDTLGYQVTFEPKVAALDRHVPDADRKAEELAQVCALAMALPQRDRGELTFPPFHTLQPADSPA